LNHPLAPDFAEMSDDVLTEKVKDLNKKLMQAYRVGSPAVQQIQMLLEDYNEERRKRERKTFEKLLEKSKDSSSDWDDIIDIGS
tara:strand:- start:219 stop:470 length:252 start_codon:yes stop_codon:yes gene_type:complete